MGAWLARRPMILDELLRRDGLQEHLSNPQCVSCLDEPGVYKCIDCSTSTLRCASCIVYQHENAPLHRLQVCPLFLGTILSHVRSGLERKLF